MKEGVFVRNEDLSSGLGVVCHALAAMGEAATPPRENQRRENAVQDYSI